ncbi:HNH endonuclease [Patescibacteria group bacterium]|nr:HNH endonuclease [Patescibacteria group bacterium]
MNACIYCKKEGVENFKGVEHVIPQSFGKFSSDTPTLRNVCDECNTYFGKELDLLLARDTIEGVTRSKKGITSDAKGAPKSLIFSLEETEENGEYGGALLGPPDPKTGKGGLLLPQFWIWNIKKDKWERYRLDQIKDVKIIEDEHGGTTPGSRQMRIYGPSKERYDEVVAELKKYNIPYREKEMMDEIPFLKNVDPDGKVIVRGTIEGTIDKRHRRAIAKVLFNFATYYIGEAETVKPEWDKARNFIRYDGDTLLGRITQKPFWTGEEKDNLRFASDSYNVRIENQGGHVVGVIQIYNIFTYEFILVENHSVPEEAEVAYRFTPGQKPYLGYKMDHPVDLS